jgi:hypothetical protein
VGQNDRPGVIGQVMGEHHKFEIDIFLGAHARDRPVAKSSGCTQNRQICRILCPIIGLRFHKTGAQLLKRHSWRVLRQINLNPLLFVRCNVIFCSAGWLARASSTAALLGRFLPRLGPFEASDGPFFLARSDRARRSACPASFFPR